MHPVMRPKISIVTVVRNGVPFVAQTIDSVLAQQYGPLEYVIVDGGSTDGTLEIIKSRQANITRWISERDAGIADAFNKGLALATGDYILFLNADDALANAHVVEDVADQILKHDWPAILYGDCAYVNRESGDVMHRIQVEFSMDDAMKGRMPPHPGMFTSRGYFDRYGTFDVRFKMAMDFDWFLRGARVERLVHVPLLVSNMRSGGTSTMNRKIAVEEIIEALRRNGYVASRWAAFRARAYFGGRSIAKKLLHGLGLYGLFARIQSRSN